jgi:xanthine dehydrogenase accessory factor
MITPMSALFTEIARRCAAGERVILCTVVKTKGSTPQRAGARMLVLESGQTVGTLGGGCVEAEVRRRALETTADRAMRFSLDHDYGWDDGLICGGVMDVLIQPLTAVDAVQYADWADTIDSGGAVVVELPYELDGEPHTFREEIGPPPALLIVGAGHVGQALARVATPLGFDVDVIDDRPDHLSPARFPSARHRIVGEIEPSLKAYVITPATYVVIVTRGHRNDARALSAVVESNARYVGLIGSKRKIKAILSDLAADGVSIDAIKKVHAPIGLEIGAVTVDEIAVSIAAELIAVRRGRGNAPVRPMRMDGDELARWIGRTSVNSSEL